jgi:hypothetical protein
MARAETAYEIRKAGMKNKATITHIENRKAGEIFGDAARIPEQLVMVIFGKIDGWEGRIGAITKPSSRYISPKSNMAKFIQKYKKPPDTGMTVEVATNDRGYWALVT